MSVSRRWPISPFNARADAVGKPVRMRIDVLLVDRGLAPTRSKAQALVLAGNVSCAGNRIDKPGQLVDRETELSVRPGRRWVGRGAQKIAPALTAFGLNPSALRIRASDRLQPCVGGALSMLKFGHWTLMSSILAASIRIRCVSWRRF